MKLGPLRITLRQLQYVVAVADEGNFRRAAVRCLVSQPSLSAQVAELERALEVQLFERNQRRVLITPVGVEIVARARTLLLGADDLMDVATRAINPLVGVLRVGIIPTFGPYLLPDLDPALRLAFPGLALEWTEDKTEVLVDNVQAGNLDAALLAAEADIQDLEVAVVGIDPFVLAIPQSHSLNRKRGLIRLSDLDGEEVLLLDDGHCFREQALAFCSASSAIEAGFRATSLTTLLQMAAGRESITLLPQIAVALENRRDTVAIRKFAKPAPSRTLVYAWRRDSPLGPSLQKLAEASRGVFAQTMRSPL